GFLLAWSLGVYAAARLREGIRKLLALDALFVLLTPLAFRMLRFYAPFEVFTAMCFVPCLLFGVLYGQLVSRSARRWGEDVGLFPAVNNVGCCCGIVFFTMVGYEVSVDRNGILLGGGLLVLLAADLAGDPASALRVPARVGAALGSAVLLVVLWTGLQQP